MFTCVYLSGRHLTVTSLQIVTWDVLAVLFNPKTIRNGWFSNSLPVLRRSQIPGRPGFNQGEDPAAGENNVGKSHSAQHRPMTSRPCSTKMLKIPRSQLQPKSQQEPNGSVSPRVSSLPKRGRPEPVLLFSPNQSPRSAERRGDPPGDVRRPSRHIRRRRPPGRPSSGWRRAPTLRTSEHEKPGEGG